MTFFSKDNLEVYLQREWAKAGWEPTDDAKIGVEIDDLAAHSMQRNRDVQSPYFDLWLRSYDEMLSWILGLFTVVYDPNSDVIINDFDRSVYILLSKILADGLAIRNLIIAGYDGAARTILRSVGEYIEVFVAILHDPSFADDFVKSDTPEGAKLFWEKSLRPRKMRNRIRTAWREFFKEDRHSEAVIEFADWGHSSFDLLSAMSHPSFGGALVTAVPLKSKQTSENWLGIWGDRSDASVDTISIFASFLFPVILLQNEFPFDTYIGPFSRKIEYDQENRFHLQVKKGRGVVASMIISMHSPENKKYVYPEADLSIFGYAKI